MTIKEFINPARIFIKTKEGKGTTLYKYLKKISEDVYSTEEVKTNEVWIDASGKKWPVYKKVFLATKGNENLEIPFPDNYNLITDIDVILTDVDNNVKKIPHYFSNEIWNDMEIGASKKIMIYGSTSNYAKGQVRVTVKYTKTTN